MDFESIKEALPKLIESASTTITSVITSATSTTTSTTTTNTSPPTCTTLSKLLPTVSLFVTSSLLHTFFTGKNKITNMNVNSIVANIYDTLVVHMTEKWYHCVLSQLDNNAVVLDVGIGTAGALLRCKELVKSKNLQIIGIDYNSYYISSAKTAIESNDMSDYISVHCIDLYDETKLKNVIHDTTNDSTNDSEKGGVKKTKGMVDVVYFSGSFSLLPDPKQALLMCLPFLKKEEDKSSKTSIYITQTYQKRVAPFMTSIKPLIKYMTTIDFGQLVKEEEILSFYNKESKLEEHGISLKSHEKIQGSLDNYWQAAYLSILEVKSVGK